MKARSLTMDDKCQQCVVCQCTVVHPCTQWLNFSAKGLGIQISVQLNSDFGVGNPYQDPFRYHSLKINQTVNWQITPPSSRVKIF